MAWTAVGAGLVLALCTFLLRVDSTVLLTLAILSGIVFGFVEWELLVALMFAAGFLAGALRMAYGTWSAYGIPDVLVALTLLRWVTHDLPDGRARIRDAHVRVAFFLLAAYCVAELFNPEAPLVRSIFGLRSWLLYTSLLLAGYSAYRNAQQFESLSRALILLAGATAAYGIWQWQGGVQSLSTFGGWYTEFAQSMVWITTEGGYVFRAPSTFVTSTSFALTMAMVFILAVGSALSAQASRTWRMACAACMILMATGIAVSGSRGGPAYLAAALCVMMLLGPKLRTVIWITVIVSLSLLVIDRVTHGVVGDRFATLLTPRIFLWKWAGPLRTGLLESLSYPFGRGLGFVIGLPQLVIGASFEGLATGASVDSGLGTVAAELGVPGLILFLWFEIALALAAIRAWRRLPWRGAREWFLGPTIWAVTFPVISPMLGPHASPPHSMFHWLFVGMLLRAGAEAERRPSPAREPTSVSPRRAGLTSRESQRRPQAWT